MDLGDYRFHSYRHTYRSLKAIVDGLKAIQDHEGASLPIIPPLGQELNSHLLQALGRSASDTSPILRETPLQKELDAPAKYQWPRPCKAAKITDKAKSDEIIIPFAHLYLQEGDTLVFVDMPASSRLSKNHTSCDGMVPPSSVVFRVHSEKLFALAGSKFPVMLRSAQHQHNVMKHRKPTEDQLRGIKYFLDLTPDIEGDDAAYHISELSLSPGLIKWPASAVLHGVDSSLVVGHDDVCHCQRPMPLPVKLDDDDETDTSTKKTSPNDLWSKLKSPEEVVQFRGSQNSKLFENAQHLKIPDYCQVRHTNAIIRLMLMIEGQAVFLNSAARVWTLVGVSKIYGCPEVIRDRVLLWITANTPFIEVLPEEALRIAFILKLPQVARLAFRILVNEAAIEGFGSDDHSKPPAELTIFGRQKGQLDDETSNIVQHAASALMDRLTQSFEWFKNASRPTAWSPPAIQTLEEIRSMIYRHYDDNKNIARALSAVTQLQTAITNAAKGVMLFHADSEWPAVARSALTEMDMCRATYAEYGEGDTFVGLHTIFTALTPRQELICPFKYHSIRQLFEDWASGADMTINECAFELRVSLEILRQSQPSPYLYTMAFPKFDPQSVYNEVSARVQTWTWFETRGPECEDLRPLLTRHMNLTLTRHEMRYLPLWAGGDNDDSGGVFAPALPPAWLGPNGPGPAYHTGYSEAPSISDEVADEISRLRLRASTVVGSLDAQDSVSTVYGPEHVIAAGSSSASESFVDDDSEFAIARLEAPAIARSSSPSIESISSTSESDSATIDSSGDDFDWVSDTDSDASDDTIMGI